MNRFASDDKTDENDPQILLWIETAMSGTNSVIFLAEDGGCVVGFTRLQRKDRSSDNEQRNVHYAHISDLYVVPEVRKRGIARLLITAAMDWANEHELSEITLNVYEDNEAARALYKAAGFGDVCLISGNRIRMKYDPQR